MNCAGSANLRDHRHVKPLAEIGRLSGPMALHVVLHMIPAPSDMYEEEELSRMHI